MTRETKVGLVVAGSFIVLVGVVVASKMRGGVETPNPEVASTVTPGGEESESPEKKSDLSKTPTFPTPPKPLPGDLRPVAASEPVPKEGGLPTLPGLPPVAAGDLPSLPSVPPPLPGISDDDQKKALDALRLAKTPTPPPGLPALPGLPKDGDLPPPSVPGPDKFAQAKDALPPLPPIPGLPAALPKADGLPPIPPVPGPAVEPKKMETPPPAVFPTPGKTDPLPPPVATKDPAPAVFPPPGKIEIAPPAVPAPPKKEVALPPLPPIDEGPFAKKTVTPPTPTPTPTPAVPPVTDRKDLVPPPPLGTGFTGSPPVGIAPPIPTTPSTLPKVTTVDIPPYVLRPEDRDLAAVSQRVYGTDRYAQALLAFNRDHPLSKDDIRKSPPRLVTGQMLYIPPRELLDGKYAALVSPEGRPVIGAIGSEVPPVKIGAIATPPTSPPPIGSPPVGTFAKEGPPVTIKAPAVGTPVSIGTPAGGAPTSGKTELTKSFVVAGTGLHIIQIAQQTLGDSRRWPEIYRLNPSIQPQNVIPGGTQIRLPMDARVP